MTAFPSVPAVRHSISIARTPGRSLRSRNSLGSDAVHALLAIPGAFDVRVESESEAVAVVSYVWRTTERFPHTQAHLAQRGLQRVDWV